MLFVHGSYSCANACFPCALPSFLQYIESLLRKYIGEYVACQMCRSFKTNLTRDNVSRLFFVACQVSTYYAFITVLSVYHFYCESISRHSVCWLYFLAVANIYITQFSLLQDCGSSRSVAQIRAGYHATTKADRRAVRNAT
jgi:translation initiation factor 2 subunit 2